MGGGVKDAGEITKDSSKEIDGLLKREEKKREEKRREEKEERNGRFLFFSRPHGRIEKKERKKRKRKEWKVVSYWLSQSSTPLSLLYSLEHDDMHILSLVLVFKRLDYQMGHFRKVSLAVSRRLQLQDCGKIQ